MKNRPTLADVARVAGVSKTTASMALNGKGDGNIPAATREKVLAAAQALQYRPHGVARALTRRRADVLGIVCNISPFIRRAQHAFEHGLLSAVFHRALECGYNPMIYGYPHDPATAEEVSRYADGRSDAFILINPALGCALRNYLQMVRIPVVALCSRSTGADELWVDSDNESGIRAAVDHLARRGHRQIAYLTGPQLEDNARARVSAFRSALRERGLPEQDARIVPYTWNMDVTRRQLRGFVSGPEPATAVLTWNDFAAEELYRAAEAEGLRIPGDLSVIGFDDTHAAPVMAPPLTTVRQDLEGMGRAAVDLALASVTADVSELKPPSVVCPVKFIERASTGRPSTGRR